MIEINYKESSTPVSTQTEKKREADQTKHNKYIQCRRPKSEPDAGFVYMCKIEYQTIPSRSGHISSPVGPKIFILAALETGDSDLASSTDRLCVAIAIIAQYIQVMIAEVGEDFVEKRSS